MTIYFMRKGLEGPIKIGYTSALAETRMAQLQVGHHEQLYLLGTIAGTISDENSLHKELERYSIRGEWFESAPELLITIADAIENKKEWYYFRQVRFNLLEIENKNLKVRIANLEDKLKTIEEKHKEKFERATRKFEVRVGKLTGKNKELTNAK